MPRLPRALVLVAMPFLLPSCGGGKTPTSGTSLPAASPTPAGGAISLTVVDGRGQLVPNAVLKVDGVVRLPRNPSGPLFEIERTLVGHALDLEREGFLLHQTFVPDRDRTLDLFEVPEGAGKAWVQALLYDGVISRNGTLARLLKPVSIVRATSLPAPTWADVRPIWEEAASAVTAQHSDRELAMLAAVKRRPAGTAFEDNVRGAAASSAATTGGRSYHCGEGR